MDGKRDDRRWLWPHVSVQSSGFDIKGWTFQFSISFLMVYSRTVKAEPNFEMGDLDNLNGDKI